MKYRYISLLAMLALGLLPLSGCGLSGNSGDAVVYAQSKKERAQPAAIATTDQSELVQDNSAFTIDVYRTLLPGHANLFYSPYSISLAMAMTYAGARGQTAVEMANTMHFSLLQERLHPAFNALDQELAKRSDCAECGDVGGEGFHLNIVNALWGQQGYTFLREYLDLLAENYGAGMRLVNFMEQPEEARQAINDWVSQQTGERIKDLIPLGAVNDMTRLVLTNAIYFKAAWLIPFQESATTTEPFNLLDNSQVDVSMMTKDHLFNYAEGEGYQVIELPYERDEIAMDILFPAKGEFVSFESTLDAETLTVILSSMALEGVSLSLPKFKIESEFSLKEALSSLGMPLAFSDAADLSGMNGRVELFIRDVLHKAFVSVDEKGTEAAAATAVLVEPVSITVIETEMKIDRPFIFLIRDLKTGSILFIGRVLNPGS